MKLTEITFPKSISLAAEVLKKYGYNRIGYDSDFAQVFHKENENSVLKLYRKTDIPYRNFVDLCRQTPNVHFPYFSRSSIAIPNTDYMAVRTELLEEGDANRKARAGSYFSRFYKFNWLIDCENAACEAASAVANVVSRPQLNLYFEWLNKNRSLVQAFMLLKNSFGDQPNVVFDLHSNNFMMRGRTLVIIDPVCIAR